MTTKPQQGSTPAQPTQQQQGGNSGKPAQQQGSTKFSDWASI
jgi:hypothetical protein